MDGEETELFLLEEIVGAAQWYPSKVNIWEQLQVLKKQQGFLDLRLRAWEGWGCPLNSHGIGSVITSGGALGITRRQQGITESRNHGVI